LEKEIVKFKNGQINLLEYYKIINETNFEITEDLIKINIK